MNARITFTSASILIALLFGVTVLLPQMWQHVDAGYSYQGVEIMPSDAEIHYSARVREFFDGHYTVANTFYKEPKDVPYLQPPYPEASIAIASALTGTDPAWLFVWSRGVFAFVLTLLLIGCVASLSGRKWESLIAVTALLFAGSVLSAPWDIPHLLMGDRMFEVLRFSRPINPLWTVSWFTAALWLLSSWVRTRSTMKIVGSALCTVVLLYSYVYAWSFLGVAMAVLFTRYVWIKDWKRVRDLLLFAGLFFLLGSPYLLNLWSTAHHPFYETASQRMGMSPLHTPVIGVWALLFVGVTLCAKRVWMEQWWLVFGLSVAGIVALNQQVITGAYLVPHHYHWYFVQPFASLTTMIVVLAVLSRLSVQQWMKKAFVITALILSVACGVLVQARAYDAARDEWGPPQRLGPVIDTLKQLPADVAVYAQDRWLLNLLPVYTSLNVYAADNANTYLVDPQQTRDVFWFELWIDGVTGEEAAERFKTDLRFTVSSHIYNIYYREYLGNYDRIPDDVLDQHIAQYQEYLKLSTQQKLCRWPLDYVVFAESDKVTSAWQQIRANTEEVLTGSGFVVRELNHDLCHFD